MAAITPQTNLRLLKNPNNLSNQNQLTFASATTQYNYFNGLTKLSVDDFTYQRKDYIIRYNACIDDILDYNYVMYQNDAYGNKWFYAYITNMRYVNDNLTEITIKTDFFQTFQFDITYKSSFIEREHVNDDTIGLHTIPENLETGEYISKEMSSSNFGTSHPVIMVTEYCKLTNKSDSSGYDMENDSKIMSAGATMSGIYQGCMFLLCGNDFAVQTIIQAYSDAGKMDSVVGMFMAPDTLTGYQNPATSDMWYFASWSGGLAYAPFTYLPETVSESMGKFSIGKPYNNIDGVVPKNNKLFTHPYIYMMGTNNTGINVIYQYELFADDPDPLEPKGFCSFLTHGVVCPGCSVKTVPLYYKGIDYNFSEGIPLGKYPICSFSTDVYTNWLTQNSVNTAISVAASGLQVVGGVALAATGAGALVGAGQIASGLTGIASTLGTIYEHSLMPPQAQGDVNTGDITYTRTGNNFGFYKMNIKAEMVHVIDNYFSMYGYKVDVVKTPNITGRTKWNFVKTIGANIEGMIPEDYLNEIKGLFDNGITLWHNPTTFLDYSQSNAIVTP